MDRIKKKAGLYVFFCFVLVFIIGCNRQAPESNDLKNTNVDNTISTKITDQPVSITGQQEDICYVTWAVPGNLIRVSDENIQKINNKLIKDGYKFQLKLIRIDDQMGDSYIKELSSSDADIVFTGFEWDHRNYVLRDVASGKYEDLTEYIEKSRLKEILPQKLLDAVSYNGKIYLLPSESGQDGADCGLLYKKATQNGGANFKEINSDIYKIEDFVSADDRLYYGLKGFEFVRFFGYYYDSLNGIVLTDDGRIINPFEDEKCLRWLYLVNKLYKEGMAPNPVDGEKIKTECNFLMIKSTDIQKEEGQVIKSFKIELCNRYNCSTAIRRDSDNKENAFKFLELIRTDHEYGNLLIYGKTKEDEEGLVDSFLNKTVFGLDDGLLQMNDGMRHFASSKERKAYYDANISVSPYVYMDIPIECYELSLIVDKYIFYDDILFHEEFESEFEAFKSEYTEAFDRIFKQ
ncbi:MAG: hypothetical protein IKO54_00195 [Lachnospiraceae bacterium]|nr:hypothetical protein [Lachnospiraceae bacterium]MBR4540577.1 hypothetical protein [Lachnospiraceae bacterium]